MFAPVAGTIIIEHNLFGILSSFLLIFSNLGSEDYDSKVHSDDNEEDEGNQVEDEDEDDNDDGDVDEKANSLYSPAQQLSDPTWPIIPVVSAIRRFHRRRRRGRRVGRWFRRRRSRG